MRTGWNPTRRNRNIGTAQSGHGQNNLFDIPNYWLNERIYWERLTDYSVVSRKIYGQPIKFIVEKTRANYFYAPTIDDITRVLHFIPKKDLAGIEMIVLYQSSRKEELLKPVWGRLAYSANIDNHSGPAIYLEAVDFTRIIKWPKSLSVDDLKEFERMRQDGHIIKDNHNYHHIELSLSSVRATQLYRTLLHEIGHWVDYLEKVKIPSQQSDRIDYAKFSELRKRYHQRPSVEHEKFAHAYADRLKLKLINEKEIPFDRVVDLKSIKRDKLRLSDFI